MQQNTDLLKRLQRDQPFAGSFAQQGEALPKKKLKGCDVVKQVLQKIFLLACWLGLGQQALADNIGIYTGTFDPPHKGHLTVIQAGLDELKLDKLYLLPNYLPEHKPGASDFSDRYWMLMLLIQASEKGQPPQALQRLQLLPALDFEQTYLQAPDNAVGLLIGLIRRQHGPQHRYFQLMGTDSLNKLVAAGRLPLPDENRTIAVLPRPGHTVVKTTQLTAAEQRGQVVYLKTPSPELSSSSLRKALSTGDRVDLESLLPAPVLDYILLRGLYLQPVQP